MSEPVFTTQMIPDSLIRWVCEQIGNDRKTFRLKYDYVLHCHPIHAKELRRIRKDELNDDPDAPRYRIGEARIVEDPETITPYLERYDYRSLGPTG